MRPVTSDELGQRGPFLGTPIPTEILNPPRLPKHLENRNDLEMLGEAMKFTFADGTEVEVAAPALNDFLRHDLKWVEFVHGRAARKELAGLNLSANPAMAAAQNVKRCPSFSWQGC